MKANFVARAFSGEPDHLASVIREAMDHPGFSLVDVLASRVFPSIKVNTFGWYKGALLFHRRPRSVRLVGGHGPCPRSSAIASLWA